MLSENVRASVYKYSLKYWNDHFFWVDSFDCPASFLWHINKKVSRDPFPKSTEFSADDYAVLVAHPAPFRKFLEPFLCLIGMSHNYTLDEDSYLTFLRDDGTITDPIKVKAGERERAEEEARFLDSIVGRVVSLLPVSPDHTESDLEASVKILFDEGGSANQGDSTVGGGQDTGTGLVTGVKIIVAENVTAEKPKHPCKKRQVVTDASELLASNMLNVEAGVMAVATLPMVTSSVSATPKHKSGALADSITGLNLHTIGASERFVISLDSSHYSGRNAFGAGDDSIIRSAVVPPVMTEAVITSHAVTVLSVLENGTKVTSSVYASMFHDFESTEKVKEDIAGSSCFARQDLLMGSRELDAETLHHLAPLALFSQIREMDYHHLFTEFNVGTARQACLNVEDLELKDLNVTVSSLRSQKDGLVDQDVQMNIVNDKVAKLDADLLEMALHLEEKFYPHLLTNIFGQRWLLTHSLKLIVVKCLNSQEYLSALGAAISHAIEKGMRDGLSVRVNHGQAEIKSHKNTSVEDIINLYRLEGPLPDASGMNDLHPNIDQLTLPVHRSEDQVVLGETSLSFALSVTHSGVERIRENVAAKRSALIGV
nr:transposase (putative), gypsy type [Tanacetum cinerariifolium]